jgi:hypothetical protein
MFSTLYTRNAAYAVKHPVRTWRVREACRLHVVSQPVCQWCSGTKKLHAHHIVPMWADETLGAIPSNFVTLCAKCHLIVGHNRSFATKYVENVIQICADKRVHNRERLAA